MPAAAPSAPEPDVEPATRRERILAQLTAIICKLSGLPADRVDPHATFLELGFDSLFLTQANAAFRAAFKIRLTTRQLIETTPVLNALAGYLDETLPADAEIGQVERLATGAAARQQRKRQRRGAGPLRGQPRPARRQEGEHGRAHARAGTLYRRPDRHDDPAHAESQGRDPGLARRPGRPPHRPGLPLALEGDGLSGPLRPGEGLPNLGRRRQRVHRSGQWLRRNLPRPSTGLRRRRHPQPGGQDPGDRSADGAGRRGRRTRVRDDRHGARRVLQHRVRSGARRRADRPDGHRQVQDRQVRRPLPRHLRRDAGPRQRDRQPDDHLPQRARDPGRGGPEHADPELRGSGGLRRHPGERRRAGARARRAGPQSQSRFPAPASTCTSFASSPRSWESRCCSTRW